jgi:hypothetical protein
MKSQTIALAAAALAVGAWLAGATATAALFSSPPPQASDSLSLSSQQHFVRAGRFQGDDEFGDPEHAAGQGDSRQDRARRSGAPAL